MTDKPCFYLSFKFSQADYCVESCTENLAIYLENGMQYSAVLYTEMYISDCDCVHSLADREHKGSSLLMQACASACMN